MRVLVPCLIAAQFFAGAACRERPDIAEIGTYNMGERAQTGPLIYTVVDSQWAISLGEGASSRVPASRFLMLNVTIANSAKEAYAVPAFTLVDDTGKTYQESDNGQGVTNWLSPLRQVPPGGSTQGAVLFDAPQKQFRLRVGDETDQKFAWIKIPLALGDSMLGKPGELPLSPAGTKQ